MSTRVAERVDEWPDEPFSDGYRQLHDLADDDFSGAVRAGGAELYMTNGAVVGVLGGDIEDFQDVTGTVYVSPSPALPLLAVMQERNDEVRAKYYTEKTGIAEVDETLSDGGFTGYVELSENVLSGDYYLVYHGGRSMSVAYVGNKPELLDGEEAFDRADGEVGIYQVRPADVDQVEIPEPPAEPAEPAEQTGADVQAEATDDVPETADSSPAEDAPEPAADAVADDGSDGLSAEEMTASPESSEPDETATETATATQEETGDSQEQSEQRRTREEQSEQQRESVDTPERPTPERTRDGSTERSSDRDTATDRTTAGRSPAPEHDQSHGTNEPTQTERRQEASGTPERQRREDSRRRTTQSQQAEPSSPTPKRTAERQSPPSETSGTTAGLETRAIPSLDPERTQESDDDGARGDSPGRRETDRTEAMPAEHQEQRRLEPARQQQSDEQTRGTEPRQQQTQTRERTPERASSDQSRQQSTTQSPSSQTAAAEESTAETDSADEESPDEDVIENLEAEIEERETEIERIESELETVSEERDDLQAELDSVRAERDELAEEVERLESELERLETEFGVATDAERRMTASEALEGTDLFVRYHSKGDATLEKAHGGSVRRDDVTENLRLEKHTQFDASAVAIGNLAYGEFLEETAEYQFVRWVIYDLLFEIRDTNYTKELSNLYDALPKIDRAELSGAVDVVYSEDGQETRTTERFDVVLRDRMGNPLLVANLNDSREAATQSMMEDLITSAERVGQTSDGFSGAFLVTQSFFEPGALETASEATKGGLLSRDKRKSFVNLSRKRGYHLCLVEARNENHHLAVPEL